MYHILERIEYLSQIGNIVMHINLNKGQMSELMKENLNLLNKMHEGLIVLSEKDDSLQVVNKPALNLLNKIPNVDLSSSDEC